MRWTTLLLLLGVARADPLVAGIDAAMDRGAGFLLSRQGADGAWRSEDYGAFKDGYTQTPFVLSALLFAPTRPDLPEAYGKGVDFLATLVDAEGRLPPVLDYPVYAPAGALMVLSVPANARHARVKAALIGWLRARQLTEHHGWAPDDLPYGGWGYFARTPTKPGPDHPPDHLRSSNLSATLFAVGALSLAGVPASDPALVKARAFVARCQNFGGDPQFADGGFFFTPSNALQNKAGVAGTDAAGAARYRSYGSMTADGLRLLYRLGGDPSRTTAARGWLERHFDPADGFGGYPPERAIQRKSVYFYQAWTVAHALWRHGDQGRARALAKALLARQRPDGTWRNPATDLREDDPLVATPLAMGALGVIRLTLTGTWQTSVPM